MSQTVDNRELLAGLVGEGRLRLTLGTPFGEESPLAGRPVSWDRVRGMMLGLAIGDALGNTSEGQLPAKRGRRHGEIRDYLPNWYAEDRRVGLPSDDTQLAFWTLEHLIEHGGLVPDRLADTFARRKIFGIGQAVTSFVRGMRAGRPWWNASARAAGNGALMRIAPIVIPHVETITPEIPLVSANGGEPALVAEAPDSQFWSDAALCAAITHNDPGSIGACVAFSAMLADLLAASRPPHPAWWVERYVEVAREVESETRHTQYEPLGGPLWGTYRGPIWRFVEEHVPEAVARGLSVVEAGDTWRSGAFLLETAPTVLFILARYGHRPEEAIVRAVNDTKDNDTIGAIVGAAVGALHGEAALPERWRDGLLGRTAYDDDGRVQELLDQAETRFGGRTGRT